MNKRRRALLFLTISVWIAYIVCAIIFGFSVWFVKVLSIAYITLFGILLFNVWKYVELKNGSQQ